MRADRRSDRKRLEDAFQRLRMAGCYAETRFWCCQTCGWAGFPVDAEERTCVFWHEQSDEGSFGTRHGNRMVRDLYLYWRGDMHEIKSALEAEGLSVELPADESKAIRVLAKGVARDAARDVA
jgi:hypothetical protein